LITAAVADMYDPMNFLVPFCSFSLEHPASSHLPAAAGTVSGLRGSDSAAEICDDDIASSSVPSLRLNHTELWHKFSAVDTEMVITKSGRHVYTL